MTRTTASDKKESNGKRLRNQYGQLSTSSSHHLQESHPPSVYVTTAEKSETAKKEGGHGNDAQNKQI